MQNNLETMLAQLKNQYKQKTSSVLDWAKGEYADQSDRHVVTLMWVLMNTGLKDSMLLIDAIRGKGHKTIEAYIMYEDKKGQGHLERWVEDVLMMEQSYSGNNGAMILKDATNHRGSWKMGKPLQEVYASVILKPEQIVLKYLVK